LNSLQSVLSNLRSNREGVDLFDLSDSLTKLCENGLHDGSSLSSDLPAIIKPNKSSQSGQKLESKGDAVAPTALSDGIAPSLLSKTFLRSVAKQISTSANRAVTLSVTSSTGRVLETAHYGWPDNSWRVELERDLPKLGRAALKSATPLLSIQANKLFLSKASTEAQCDKPGNSEVRTISSINLNHLSDALNTPLLLLPIPLQQSSGQAMLLVDASSGGTTCRDQFLAEASRWWLGETWVTNLTTQLDAWLLIQRSKQVTRVMRIVDWVRSYSYWWCAPVAIILISLAVPVPYFPRRECVFEPEQKQFIASPIQGRISMCSVRPGDTVEKGQLLARLDDDQLQRDLATAQAELESAQKKRDSALATRAAGNAGIADIEMTQARLKIESLRDQLGRMEIRANAAGVVVQGDWHRSIGMPVNLGQSLFEVAELESMTAEVRLSAADLGQIHVGDPVSIRSDASGGESFTGKIGRIEPRATVIDDEAVFIADVVIRDPMKKLRPGMNATAQVTAAWKSLGWILFHRPYRWLANQWIW
jgi:hypothetical protein